jgi:Nop14-like family
MRLVCLAICRERAATKRLKRQVQKERRGAMRELRKDAAFLDAEREQVGVFNTVVA